MNDQKVKYTETINPVEVKQMEMKYQIATEPTRMPEPTTKINIPSGFTGAGKVLEPEYPCMVVFTERKGNMVGQHKKIAEMLAQIGYGGLQPTYHIEGSENYRYHFYNPVSELGKEVLTTKAKTLKVGNLTKEFNSKFPGDEPTPQGGKEDMTKKTKPKSASRISVVCTKCNHKSNVNPDIKRIRCSKCHKDLTSLVRGAKPAPQPVPETPPEAIPGPSGPTLPPAGELVPPQAPEQPTIAINEPVRPPAIGGTPQPIPTEPPVTPEPLPTPGIQPIQEDMFTVAELKEIIAPLHMMEQYMVNTKAGRTVVTDPMVGAMNKSLGIILKKIEEMYPDKAIMIALGGYIAVQSTIVGSMFLPQGEQPPQPPQEQPPQEEPVYQVVETPPKPPKQKRKSTPRGKGGKKGKGKKGKGNK